MPKRGSENSSDDGGNGARCRGDDGSSRRSEDGVFGKSARGEKTKRRERGETVGVESVVEMGDGGAEWIMSDSGGAEFMASAAGPREARCRLRDSGGGGGDRERVSCPLVSDMQAAIGTG